DHPERVILMQRETDVACAVRDHDRLAWFVTQCCRDFGAQHSVMLVFEPLSFRQLQLSATRKAEVFEIVVSGPENTETPMRIAQRQRDGPCDLGAAREGGVAVPADVVGGIADPEHRVEEQMYRAAA